MITPDDEKIINSILERKHMKFTIFLSTDGKHTVQVDAEKEELTDASLIAQKEYDAIVSKYGTKQEQAVKAYAAKPSFPDDTGDRASAGSPGIPICAIHHKPMTEGKWGFYCKTPDETQPKGWCTYKPPKV